MYDKEKVRVVVAHELLETYSVQLCMQYDLFVEVDFANDVYRMISYSEKYCNIFAKQGDFSSVVNDLGDKSVHKEDKADFKEFFDISRWRENEDSLEFPEFTEFRILVNDAKYRWLRGAIFRMQHRHKPIMLCCFFDISEKKFAKSVDMGSYPIKLEAPAKDALTNLHTYQGIQRAVNDKVDENIDVATFLCVDIENFCFLNDHLGRAHGDQLLVFFSKALRKFCGGDELIGRIGAAQFVVFLPGVEERTEVLEYANRVFQLFSATEHIDLLGLELSCSIGAALYPQDGFTYSDLAYNADRALYYAKQQGKNQIVFYGEVCDV